MPSRTCLFLAALALVSACKRNTPAAPASPPPAAPAPAAPAAASPTAAPSDVKAAPGDAWGTPSGLSYKILTPGTGTGNPEPQDLVDVHFAGWTADGQLFDSALAPASTQFELATAMPGWIEALSHMVEGEKRRLWVPAKLSYAQDDPRKRTPPGALVFDLELVKIIKRPRPVPAPADVAAPPRSAKRGKGGVRWRMLSKGAGHHHPRPRDTVQVHYTRWTPDGKMIDSSLAAGQPTTMRADSMGPAWTEALHLLVPGGKARFWMPAALVSWAGPATTVVYDIELVAIK
jgi:FKBP-type peptidyl-prolyl cis-trans isomerase